MTVGGTARARSAIGVVRVKPGVTFTTIAPAGFRLLAAFELAAAVLGVELVITSACDGQHSGPNDPHHRGVAYDVRTRNLRPEQVSAVLDFVMDQLREPGGPAAAAVDGAGTAFQTERFFGFVEGVGTANEHLHFQLRKGRQYP